MKLTGEENIEIITRKHKLKVPLVKKQLPEVSYKKVFLRNSQNSQKNTCVRVSFFNKVMRLRPASLFKKRLWHKCCPVNFVKFSRITFSQNTSGRLLFLGVFQTYMMQFFTKSFTTFRR